jgi:outer membrane protein assembly factor BamB
MKGRIVAKPWLASTLAFCALQTGVRADDWPHWMGPTRDGVWTETGVMEKLPKTLTPKWRAPVKYGYAGPAVAGGFVYVFDFDGEGDFTADPGKRNKPSGKERLLCFDAKTGEQKWKFEYDCQYDVSYPAGPRATPTVFENKVYTLGTMGHLSCVDARTGEMQFQVDLKERFGSETQIWGFSSHPLVDGDKVYVMAGGSGSGVVALDRRTGETRMKAIDLKEPGYCPVTTTEAGGQKQLLVVTPKNVHGLDPQDGKEFWSVPFEPAYGMSICAPQRGNDTLFVTGEGDKAVAIKLAADKPAVTELWRGKSNTAVYPICGTPLVHEGHIYGVCTNGELRCVDLKTGKRVWTDTKPITGGKRLGSGSAFIVRNGDRWFIASETGDLIIAKLSPKKYEEISRAKLIEPTGETWGRKVVWSHPAYADKHVFARNDKEILCVSLAAE